MIKGQTPTANQLVLARLVLLYAAETSRHALRPAPGQQLMDLVDEAIADKCRQLAELASLGTIP